MTTHVQLSRLVVLAMLSLSVFGCGWFGDDQPVEKDPNDYLQAESEPDLRVPADLVSRPDLDPFPVPQIPTQPNPSFYPAACLMRCMPTTHATKVYKGLVAHVVSGSRAAHHSVAKAEAIC